MGKRLRKYLLAGAAVVVPLTVTFYVLWFIFGALDGWARSIIFMLTGEKIFGVGLVLILLLLLFVGLFATNFIGNRIINFWEAFFCRIPIVCVIYKTTKQLVQVLSSRENRPFRQVVAFEYPRKGVYTVAFATGEVKMENENGKRGLVCVFICTTPNPTTGFLVLVPREEIIYLKNPTEDLIQLVLSGGIVGSFKNGEDGIVLCCDNTKPEVI